MPVRSLTASRSASALGLILLGAVACGPAPEPETPAPASLDRADFNLAAQRLDLPLVWLADGDADGQPAADEIAVAAFYDESDRWQAADLETDLGPAVEAIRAEIREPGGSATLAPEEAERRRLVRAELDQANPTVIAADLSGGTPVDHEFVGHMLAAGAVIDRLHALQKGIVGLEAQIPADDPASRRLFRRNWGPACVGNGTQEEPACSAIPGSPEPAVDVYPSGRFAAESCAFLDGVDDPVLRDPFTVVREVEGVLVAVPYAEAYRDGMAEVATALRAAAGVWPEGEETALVAYLEAAAQAFETNDWYAADEHWAAMDANNSSWYVRVAPDEVYWEPCALKAGFHLTFARIDPSSIEWQSRLAPLRAEMEAELAAIAGPPYAVREVDFQLPDFLELVANFGDDRAPVGGTAGQSLPNWGPVANEGRGRTVAMTNLGTDPDSRRVKREQLAAMVDASTLELLSETAPQEESELLDTILHEAAHNLGPAHEYEVGGQTDVDLFGGALASVYEELKAQVFGMRLVDFLRERGLVDEAAARESYASTFAWSMRHISRGMWTGDGAPRAYSQLAAIIVGSLLQEGAMELDPELLAANGVDQGAFVLHFDRFPAAVDALARTVGRIKAQGLVDDANALRDEFVDGDTVPFDLIEERIRRYPQRTFVYSISM